MLTPLINALYDTEASLPSKTSYYHLAIEELEAYSISSQIYHLLKENGDLEKTPLFFQVRLKEKYDEALFQNFFIKNQLNKLLGACEDKRIEVIPLKGVYFAEEYFGHLGARGTTDIDILVNKESVENTVEIVKSLGFNQVEEWIPEHFHCSFSKEIPGSRIPLVVEIHWDIVKESTARFNIEEFWNEASAIDNHHYIKRLSDQHTFYLMCLHGWRHNLDSPKYFIDILQLIFTLRDRLNYEELLGWAKKHSTRKRLIRTLSIVYETYPMLDDMLPLPDRRSIKKEGSLSGYRDFIDFQFFSYDSFRHSMKELYRWFLPKKSELKAEIGSRHVGSSYVYGLFCLYKLRIGKALRAMYMFVKGADQV
jgi:hypothetical protein